MAAEVLTGVRAHAVIARLASENPVQADVINELGNRILDLSDVGVRDTIPTYDASFVGRVNFATFITPNYQGRWNRILIDSSALVVQVKHVNARQFPWIEPDPRPFALDKDFYFMRVGNTRDIDRAMRVIRASYEAQG
ncbi:MAG: hypothetical protein F4X57_14565 [Chloroflexi bacterium]|nr:hypothetical protein [Chloroflexota bacterium]